MAIFLPLLVAILGAVLYLVLNSPESAKVQNMALWAYVVGLLVFLLQGAGQVVSLLK